MIIACDFLCARGVCVCVCALLDIFFIVINCHDLTFFRACIDYACHVLMAANYVLIVTGCNGLHA